MNTYQKIEKSLRETIPQLASKEQLYIYKEWDPLHNYAWYWKPSPDLFPVRLGASEEEALATIKQKWGFLSDGTKRIVFHGSEDDMSDLGETLAEIEGKPFELYFFEDWIFEPVADKLDPSWIVWYSYLSHDVTVVPPTRAPEPWVREYMTVGQWLKI